MQVGVVSYLESNLDFTPVFGSFKVFLLRGAVCQIENDDGMARLFF